MSKSSREQIQLVLDSLIAEGRLEKFIGEHGEERYRLTAEQAMQDGMAEARELKQPLH